MLEMNCLVISQRTKKIAKVLISVTFFAYISYLEDVVSCKLTYDDMQWVYHYYFKVNQ